MYFSLVIVSFMLLIKAQSSFSGRIPPENEDRRDIELIRQKRNNAELDRALQFCLDSSQSVFTGYVNCRASQRGTDLSVRCTFSCPAGSSFSSSPAQSYKCDPYTGAFSPSNVPACIPDSVEERCQNGGQRTYGGSSVGYYCRCPAEWKGPQCQYRAGNCKPQTLIDLGFNGRVNCRISYESGQQTFSCKLSCAQDDVFTFPPAEAYYCDYASGQFNPQRLPKCVPRSANNRCQNGGEWLYGGRDIGYFCRCPAEWKGPQCQYPASNCSPQTLIDLGFNGRVSCQSSYGRGEQTYTCELSCLNGDELDRPASAAYHCDYATGHFTPTGLPRCVHPDTELIFPNH